jgi:hypothetical protein
VVATAEPEPAPGSCGVFAWPCDCVPEHE